jgi:hypothetical protein
VKQTRHFFCPSSGAIYLTGRIFKGNRRLPVWPVPCNILWQFTEEARSQEEKQGPLISSMIQRHRSVNESIRKMMVSQKVE